MADSENAVQEAYPRWLGADRRVRAESVPDDHDYRIYLDVLTSACTARGVRRSMALEPIIDAAGSRPTAARR